MSNPDKHYEETIKWILRYLRATITKAFCFESIKIELHGYIDYDLVGDIDGRRSITCYIFTLENTTVN